MALEVRNLFDQYKQPENRLSHALAVALAEDPRLRRSFLRHFVNSAHDTNARIDVAEQRLPGEPDTSEEEADRRGLPDICLYNDDGWALAIECKVEARLSAEQLIRHRRTLERRGFDPVTVLAVTGKDIATRLPRKIMLHKWTDFYDWACAERVRSEWATRFADYLETVERTLVEDKYLTDATLTHFSGVPFSPNRPYTYLEAKRVLRLAMDELRNTRRLERALGADLKARGRTAITGKKGSSVWDFIPLKAAHSANVFTQCPHMTLSIGEERFYPHVTIPNGIRGTLKKNLLDLKWDGFREVVADIAGRMCRAVQGCPGAHPTLRLQQRHYRSQRSEPTVDALVHLDLRTALRRAERPRDRSGVKYQPQWLEAAFSAFENKASNLQLELGLWMAYDRCPEVRTRKALDLVVATWLSCKPILRIMLR